MHKQNPFRTNKISLLEDKFGVEKPLVEGSLNTTDKKMKTDKVQSKKQALAKKITAGMKAKMNAKGAGSYNGMPFKQAVKSTKAGGMKAHMNAR